jgi:hypothetical protein
VVAAALAGALSASACSSTAREQRDKALPSTTTAVDSAAPPASRKPPPGVTSDHRRSPPRSEPQPRDGNGERRASSGAISSTADTIKLGFVIVSGDPGAAFGLPIGQKDHAPVVQAVVDELNATGGVAGRRVVASVRSVDQTDQSKPTQVRLQNRVCTALTEDDRVFAAIGGPVEFAAGPMTRSSLRWRRGCSPLPARTA